MVVVVDDARPRRSMPDARQLANMDVDARLKDDDATKRLIAVESGPAAYDPSRPPPSLNGGGAETVGQSDRTDSVVVGGVNNLYEVTRDIDLGFLERSSTFTHIHTHTHTHAHTQTCIFGVKTEF